MAGLANHMKCTCANTMEGTYTYYKKGKTFEKDRATKNKCKDDCTGDFYDEDLCGGGGKYVSVYEFPPL